jgi:hypothetical protein
MSQGPNPKAIDALGSLKLARIPEKQAGYMELRGAQKDADCRKVEVDGGVSGELGCCNFFEPENERVQTFCCGNCEYVKEIVQAPVP